MRLKLENADLRAMLREIRRTVIASVRGEDHAASLTDDEVDEHAVSTPVDVANLVARMQSAEALRDEAQAIIAGRATAPTDAEIEAHNKSGGTWYVRRGDRAGVLSIVDETRWIASEGGYRWWALDAEGRPCAWPVVEAK